jgi:hypothetical protein
MSACIPVAILECIEGMSACIPAAILECIEGMSACIPAILDCIYAGDVGLYTGGDTGVY